MNRLSGYHIQSDHSSHLYVPQQKGGNEKNKRVDSVRKSAQLGGEEYRSSAEGAKKHRYSNSVKTRMSDRIGKAFKAVLASLLETFRRSLSHLGQFGNRGGEVSKSEEVFDENPEEVSLFEKKLQDDLYSLSGRIADVSSANTNLMDVYTLTVGEGETSEEVADAFVTALEDSEKSEYKIFVFKGRKEEVSPINQKALGQLHHSLKNVEFREALFTCLKVKVAEKNNSIHILPPLQKAIDNLSDEDEAQVIGKYLMGEICETGGGIRSFDLPQLDRILNHEQIKGSPLLTKGALLSAREVMKDAILKSQSNILLSVLEMSNFPSKESKQIKKQIIDFEMSNEDNLKIDRAALVMKAKELGLIAGIDNPEIQKRLDVVDNYIEIDKRLLQLIEEREA